MTNAHAVRFLSSPFAPTLSASRASIFGTRGVRRSRRPRNQKYNVNRVEFLAAGVPSAEAKALDQSAKDLPCPRGAGRRLQGPKGFSSCRLPARPIATADRLRPLNLWVDVAPRRSLPGARQPPPRVDPEQFARLRHHGELGGPAQSGPPSSVRRLGRTSVSSRRPRRPIRRTTSELGPAAPARARRFRPVPAVSPPPPPAAAGPRSPCRQGVERYSWQLPPSSRARRALGARFPPAPHRSGPRGAACIPEGERSNRRSAPAWQRGYTSLRPRGPSPTRASKKRSIAGLSSRGGPGRPKSALGMRSRRLGGVVTQRPAKPFTPVRFR
jgi:hypothetical protein